LSQA